MELCGTHSALLTQPPASTIRRFSSLALAWSVFRSIEFECLIYPRVGPNPGNVLQRDFVYDLARVVPYCQAPSLTGRDGVSNTNMAGELVLLCATTNQVGSLLWGGKIFPKPRKSAAQFGECSKRVSGFSGMFTIPWALAIGVAGCPTQASFAWVGSFVWVKECLCLLQRDVLCVRRSRPLPVTKSSSGGRRGCTCHG